MPDRAHDIPMSPRERAAVAKAIDTMRRARAQQERADAAYRKVLQTTGDRDRAELVRAKLLGQKPPVAPLTAKAAASKRGLPSPSLSSTAVRGKVVRAGITPTIPGGGLIGKAGGNIVEDAYYAPAGIFGAGKAATLDARDTLTGHPTLKRTGHVAKEVGKSTVDTVRHPLRRPGDTLLLGWGAVGAAGGAVSRISAAARAARLAEATGKSPTREAIAAAARRPAPAARTRTLGGLEVKSRASLNPAVRVAQRAYDRALEQSGALAEGQKIRRVGREIAQQRRVDAAVGRAPAVALHRAGKKLTAAQQLALRAVHEGVPVDDVIAAHRRWIDEAPDARAKAALSNRLALLEEAKARGYVVTRDGKPELGGSFETPRKTNGRKAATPEQLADVSRLVDEVAGSHPGGREAVLKATLGLPDQWFEPRRHAPGRQITGDEQFAGGRTRIPDTQRTAKPAGRTPARYQGGVPRKPGSLTHEYTGASRRKGAYPISTTRAVAESAVEATRYADLERLRSQVARAGLAERPATGDFRPVRTRKLNSKESTALRAMLQRADAEPEALTATEARRIAHAYQQHVSESFPNPSDYAHVRAGEKVDGVVWVPAKLLDGINRDAQAGLVSKGLVGLDTVQNVAKAGMLYLKPAYVTANAAGNAIFNVVHQGVLAPANWYRAAKLGDDARLSSLVDETMGSGASRALGATNPRGPAAHATQALGDALGRVTDTLFRRAAFLHEARRVGAKNPAQLHDLLTNPARRAELHEVVGRATSAIVDYDRLGPFERDVVRRVLFIYPWVKGATMYAGHFVAEHPVQSAVYSQLAQVGERQAQQDLGDVPSWARGTFKVGGSDQLPLVVNPSGLSPFSQAADIVSATMGALNGDKGESGRLFGLLNPVIQQAIESAQGRDSFTGAPLKGAPVETFAKGLIDQTAPGTLLHNLTDPSQTYPMNKGQAVERFAVGSFAPRNASRAKLNEYARQDDEGNLTPGQRARRRVFRERQQVYETMRSRDPSFLGPDGELKPEVKQAYNREATVEAARAEARHQSRGDSLSYYRDVAVREARLLEQWGQVPHGFANTVQREVANASLETVKSGVAKMRRDLMGAAYRDITSEGRKYLERRGVK